MSFGPTLRVMRERTRISQSGLAKLAAYDHSYVSRLEAGERLPTRDAVTRLCKAMALDPDSCGTLLAAAGFLPDDIGVLYHHPELAQLDRALAACTDQQVLTAALGTVSLVIRALQGSGENSHHHGTAKDW
jgi:transcriptional regulator with XRE-family HTH domain